MGQMDRHWTRISVAIASGSTASTAFCLRGFAMGEAIVPSKVRGNISYRVKHAKTGTESKLYDDTSTGITQTVVAWTKPLTMAMRPEVFAAGFAKFICTSVCSRANQAFDVFLKG